MQNRDGYHDIGGQSAGPVEPVQHQMVFWERQVEAMRDLLAKRTEPLVRTDELRRSMETMGEDAYNAITFYERKAFALREILLEKEIIGVDELAKRLEATKQNRKTALEELPSRYEHSHDHPDIKDDDPNPSEFDVLAEAIHDLLVEKGCILASDVTAVIERMENAGPANGAKVVARAWSDRAFKKRLLGDGKQTMLELGIDALETQIIVTENTPQIHNVIVCTLCSCYPRSVLGSPPAWYVSKPYRSRVIREPRLVLKEFGTNIPEDVEVCVHDSTADMRYMVLPMRPEETDHLTEQKLAQLVTRDNLIGVTQVQPPESTSL
jgi:nitrile hydratase